ncbi:MAG: amidophosphoribosyltransferase [Ardenticatenaceae bacterium]|nr:amidophosphoribosyltransferase [Ardenticatenaceae bacterium]
MKQEQHDNEWWGDDKFHDECGIFGIYAPGQDVARLTYFGLHALQHRGQESAGICTYDGRTTHQHKEMGLVPQIFTEEHIKRLTGHMAIGHVRYSTTGSSHLRNAQPHLIETIYGPLALGHNGNLTNALDLRHKLLQRGVGLSSTTDSEVITQVLASPSSAWASEIEEETSIPLTVFNGGGHFTGKVNPSPELMNGFSQKSNSVWEKRLTTFMRVAQGAFSLVLLTAEGIYAMRDPLGLRPLSIGELDDGYVVASETCAILTMGAKIVRDVEPGEIIRLDKNGITTIARAEAPKQALCIFEYVYFARPDSMFEGQIIHEVRQRLGEQLAAEAPAEADFVMGVPDSAIPAAIGYSRTTGIPFNEGLTKNRYIGRTFIQPTNEMREERVRLKYNPLPSNLAGKRVILIDDSIVRGNTIGPIISLLREAGAIEVHVRVSSPPVRHPCFMGIDMATYNQLIGHRMDINGIRRKIGADSLAYLSLPGMEKAVKQGVKSEKSGHCTACFSGNYPLDVPDWLFSEERGKFEFEDMWG